MAFLAMHDEPDLDALLTNWLGASRQVLAPLVQWEEGTMSRPSAQARSQPEGQTTRTQRGRHGPKSTRCGLDPRVAFTAEGSRLGRGGGFYDRFLRSLPKSTLRIGVFLGSNMPVLPIERHDEPVSFLLTEAG